MTFKGNAVRETISAAGVILGLAFVGYQLMQANAMARIEANISSGDRWMAWNNSVAAEPGLSELLARVLSEDLGRRELTAAEAMRLQLIYGSAAHGWEAGFLNGQAGLTRGDFALPDTPLFQGRFSRETWPLVRSQFDARFARVFETRYGLAAGSPGQ